MTDTLEVVPLSRPPDASVVVPGSRSITNRALVCAALADGTSSLSGVLAADDTAAMLDCLSALGIAVRADLTAGNVEIDGCAGTLPPGPAQLHARLSGTTSRFVTAVCALGSGDYTIDADEPMRSRPMGDLVAALGSLGVSIDDTNGHLPITVHSTGLRGGEVEMPGDVSSQFLSALLLAAPASRDGVTVRVVGELKSVPYVEMTRHVMGAFGVDVDVTSVAAQRYRAGSFAVEPDASTACYFLAAAAITGGRVRIEGLGSGSWQGDLGFVDVLDRMGCSAEHSRTAIEVQGPEKLSAVDVDLADISDQASTFAAVAAYAEGTSRATGIGFIRRKESNRIGAVVEGLARLGIDATDEDDGFAVVGGTPHGGTITTYDDHRIAMSFAVMGLRTAGVVIEDPACVAKTFPGFFAALDQLRSVA